MNGDRPSDQLTYAHRCQSTTRRVNRYKLPPTTRKKCDESNEGGTNRTRVLTGCKREQTVIIFRNFTQELVEWENGGVPRIERIRKDGHGGNLGDTLAYARRG